MNDHKEKENWFSGIIGFFYDHGIGNGGGMCDIINIDKNEILKFYLSTINYYDNYENNELFSMYQLLNIIISKFLLSLYYYKDIILDKRNSILKEFKHLENVHVMSHNQFENFNDLKMINLCKDEISAMENYFESRDNNGPNENQLDYSKKKELLKLNDLGYCYQYGIGKKKDEFKAFEFYLKSAEGGNSGAQNNLGYCYQNGIGVTKDEEKAFEWYLKAANEGDSYAQYNLGVCYQIRTGIIKKHLNGILNLLKNIHVHR